MSALTSKTGPNAQRRHTMTTIRIKIDDTLEKEEGKFLLLPDMEPASDLTVQVFFDSPGGSTTSKEVIQAIIESQSERVSFEFYAAGQLVSSAFSLFFATQGVKKRAVLPSAVGAIHNGSTQHTTGHFSGMEGTVYLNNMIANLKKKWCCAATTTRMDIELFARIGMNRSITDDLSKGCNGYYFFSTGELKSMADRVDW